MKKIQRFLGARLQLVNNQNRAATSKRSGESRHHAYRKCEGPQEISPHAQTREKTIHENIL